MTATIAIAAIALVTLVCRWTEGTWLARSYAFETPSDAEIVETRPTYQGPVPRVLNAPEAPIVAVGVYRVAESDPATCVRWDSSQRRYRDGRGRFARL